MLQLTIAMFDSKGAWRDPQESKIGDEQSDQPWKNKRQEEYELWGKLNLIRVAKSFTPSCHQVIMEDIDKQKKKEKQVGITERWISSKNLLIDGN